VSRPDYPMLRPNGSSPPTEVALVVNNAMQGRLNAVFDVPIELGAEGAMVVDKRISPYSMLIAEPGSSITGHTVAAGVLMLSVNPGPARFERILVAG
jgi:hypothetical protein